MLFISWPFSLSLVWNFSTRSFFSAISCLRRLISAVSKSPSWLLVLCFCVSSSCASKSPTSSPWLPLRVLFSYSLVSSKANCLFFSSVILPLCWEINWSFCANDSYHISILVLIPLSSFLLPSTVVFSSSSMVLWSFSLSASELFNWLSSASLSLTWSWLWLSSWFIAPNSRLRAPTSPLSCSLWLLMSCRFCFTYSKSSSWFFFCFTRSSYWLL